jgi:hypothetical protein
MSGLQQLKVQLIGVQLLCLAVYVIHAAVRQPQNGSAFATWCEMHTYTNRSMSIAHWCVVRGLCARSVLQLILMSANDCMQAGPSDQQRATAAAARQQLLDDLQAQVAEKAARAAAEAAAEAARTAGEAAAIHRYYAGQQQQKEPQQQQQQHSPPQAAPGAQVIQPASWGASAAVNKQGANSSFGLGSGGQAMLQALVAEASGRAVHAGAAAAPCSSSTAARTVSTAPVAVRKGRSKNVIEAPWLDQLQQPAQQATQQQQQKLLSAQASSYAVAAQPEPPPQQQQLGASSSTMYVAAPVQQQSLANAAAAAVGEQLSSQQLAAALQELQQEQQLMWQEFTRQAR